MTEDVKPTIECTFDQDLALVHACKNGDAAAFEQLVERYDVRLFGKQRTTKEFSMDEDFHGEERTAPFEVADWAPNPEELYRGSELRDILRSELQELRPSLRVVFVLRDIEGLSTEQTAEALELTPVAVKARLWRARLQLRAQLSKYFGVSTPCS